MKVQNGDCVIAKYKLSDVGGRSRICWAAGVVRMVNGSPMVETDRSCLLTSLIHEVNDDDILVVGGKAKVPAGDWYDVDLSSGAGITEVDCGSSVLEGTFKCSYMPSVTSIVFPDKCSLCWIHGTSAVVNQEFDVRADFRCTHQNMGDYRHIPKVGRSFIVMVPGTQVRQLVKHIRSIPLLSLARSGCSTIVVDAIEGDKDIQIENPAVTGIFRKKLALTNTEWRKYAVL